MEYSRVLYALIFIVSGCVQGAERGAVLHQKIVENKNISGVQKNNSDNYLDLNLYNKMSDRQIGSFIKKLKISASTSDSTIVHPARVSEEEIAQFRFFIYCVQFLEGKH